MKEFFPLIIFSINKTLWLPLFWLLSPVRSGGEKEQKKFFFFAFLLSLFLAVFLAGPQQSNVYTLSPHEKKKRGGRVYHVSKVLFYAFFPCS
jgi:hypothetical protein